MRIHHDLHRTVHAGTKVCEKCGEDKTTSAFAYDERSGDGYQIWCNTCKNEGKYAVFIPLQKIHQDRKDAAFQKELDVIGDDNHDLNELLDELDDE